MRIFIYTLLTICVLLSKSNTIYAIESIPFINNFTRKTYNAGTQNWSMAQKPSGLMFAANNNGLLVMQGKEWSCYPMPNGQIMRVVYPFTDGRIYAGGGGNFGYYEQSLDGRYNFVSLYDPNIVKGYNWGEVWRIFEVNSDIYFQAGQAIFVYRKGSSVAECLIRQSNITYSTVVNNMILINIKEKGLMAMSQSGVLIPMPKGDFFANREIRSIIRHNSDELVIATLNDGIWLYSHEEIKKMQFPPPYKIDQEQIYSAVSYKDSLYFFGTVQNGVYVTNKKFDKLKIINKRTGLQNNTVLSMCIDSYDNLWLGLDNGIDYIRLDSPLSRLYINKDIGTPYVSNLFNGKLYIGTNKGLYSIDVNLQDGHAEFIAGSQGQVWALTEIENQLYCGSHSGSYRLSGHKLLPISNNLGAMYITKIAGSDGYYLQLTYRDYILLHLNNGKLEQKSIVKRPRGMANDLQFDNDGFAWGHKDDSVYKMRFDPQTFSFIDTECIKYKADYGNLKRIQKINNRVVFVTGKGVLRYDNSSNLLLIDDSLSIFSKNNLYPSLFITDKVRNLWFRGENCFGVLRGGAFVLFNELIDDLTSWQYGVSIINDKLALIHTIDGVVVCNLERVKDLSSEFITTIYAVDYDYCATIINGKPQIPYAKNTLRFNFCTNYFSQTEGIEYSYCLKGFDEKWSSWSTTQTKEYTNLYEGNYSFIVRSRNHKGEMGKCAQFDFVIKPPFHRSGIAYIFYGLVCCAFLYVIYRIIMRIIARREQRIKIGQIRKMEELRRQHQIMTLEQDKEIMHLRNIKLQQDMAYQTKELANHTRRIIQKNDMLEEIKQELIQLHGSNSIEQRNRRIASIMAHLDRNMNNDGDWDVFETYFNKIHENFLFNLKKQYPMLTSTDLKFCAYLKMHKTTKEIASLLRISYRGVETGRYRIRKKLGLKRGESIAEILTAIETKISEESTEIK